MRAAGALLVSHFLHLRAEVCSDTLDAELALFGPEDRVGIVRLMDHTRCQRQFVDLTQLRTYMRGKHGFTEADFEAQVAYRCDLVDRVRDRHIAAVLAGPGGLARYW